MTTLKIKVTKEIITSPSCCRRDGSNCAVATAVRDIFPFAHVSPHNIYPFAYNEDKDEPKLSGRGAIIIQMPKNACEFIVDFDNSFNAEELSEVEFEIEIPDEAVEKINIDEIKSLLQNHPTLELTNN